MYYVRIHEFRVMCRIIVTEITCFHVLAVLRVGDVTYRDYVQIYTHTQCTARQVWWLEPALCHIIWLGMHLLRVDACAGTEGDSCNGLIATKVGTMNS